jgi:hypothetical protein
MGSVVIPRRGAEIGLYGLFLAVAVVAFAYTATFPAPLLRGYPGSAMFPRLVLAAMGAICALGIARAALLALGGAAPAGAPIRLPLAPFAAVIAAVAVFVVLLAAAGMEIAVFALIGGGLWFRTRRPVVAAVAGVLAVGVVYLVFAQALSVHLPLTMLPRYPGWF